MTTGAGAGVSVVVAMSLAWKLEANFCVVWIARSPSFWAVDRSPCCSLPGGVDKSIGFLMKLEKSRSVVS